MPNFWKRNFASPATPGQRLFDFLFGVLAPWLCVYFDPAIFRSDAGAGSGLLTDFRFFAFTEIAIGTLALTYFLYTRRPSPFLAGTLFAGALFSFALGIAILPYTLLGLILIIGVLGLTPFLTAFVFLRNAMRCWNQSAAPSATPDASSFASGRPLPSRIAGIVALGAALILGIPATLQAYALHAANRAIATLQSGTDQDFPRAVKTLQLLRFATNTDDLAFAYERSKDPAQRERLARAYRAVTNRDVTDRLVSLHD